MSCYLIDASALVAFIHKDPAPEMTHAWSRMVKLVGQKSGRGGPSIYVPNFCLAECSKAFANIFLKRHHCERGEERYRSVVGAMLDWVSSSRRGVIQSYELRREHLVDIEAVFLADHHLADRSEKRLSGLDGLIIAMGRALERSQGKVVIVTNDKRLAKVCNHNPGLFPQAAYIKEQEIPGT